MDFSGFCKNLTLIKDLSSVDKALAIIWWHELHDDLWDDMSASQLAKIMKENKIGNPNPRQLEKQLRACNLLIDEHDSKFTLGIDANPTMSWMLLDIIEQSTLSTGDAICFLSDTIWQNTRGYLQKVCHQLNKCYQYQLYDAAAILLRRIIETLLIEAYEYKDRQEEIMGPDGNYLLLGDLIAKSVKPGGLILSRESKKALKEIKETGDRSAHNRRINATKQDLDKVSTGARVAIEDLINISHLR